MVAVVKKGTVKRKRCRAEPGFVFSARALNANWKLRFAREEDISALEILIPLSVRTLQVTHYAPAQIEAAELLCALGAQHFVQVAPLVAPATR